MNGTVSEALMHETAWKEGWTIAECGLHPDGARVVQLQKMENCRHGSSNFAEDRDAWQHVVTQARDGWPYHRMALGMVDHVERGFIEAACGTW